MIEPNETDLKVIKIALGMGWTMGPTIGLLHEISEKLDVPPGTTHVLYTQVMAFIEQEWEENKLSPKCRWIMKPKPIRCLDCCTRFYLQVTGNEEYGYTEAMFCPFCGADDVLEEKNK